VHVSIDDYDLTGDTRAAGFGALGFRLAVTRQIEIVMPLRVADPKLYDRAGRTVEITFTVKRTHSSIAAAETFAILHERTVPQSGAIKITSQSGIIVRNIANGFLLQHELAEHNGVTTFHQYRIIGGPLTNPLIGPGDILTETGDKILTETGDNIGLE
jgi:hypothetical protein